MLIGPNLGFAVALNDEFTCAILVQIRVPHIFHTDTGLPRALRDALATTDSKSHQPEKPIVILFFYRFICGGGT